MLELNYTSGGKNMRIAAFASNPQDLHLIKSVIEEFRLLGCPHPILTSFHALNDQSILEYSPDIIFLALEHHSKVGIETARRLRRRHRHAFIIFISDHALFVEESYELNAYHYLIKPFSRYKIHKLLNELFMKIHYQNRHSIMVPSGDYTQKISFDQIVYIEVLKHQIVYHLVHNKTMVNWGSLKDLEQTLIKDKRFIKCHRSYIINLDFVTKIGEGALTLLDTKEIPISRKRYGEIKSLILRLPLVVNQVEDLEFQG